MRTLMTLLLMLFAAAGARAERIKDMAQVQGVRTNQLVGYGLVVGLPGTGDQTSQAPFTVQSLTNMLAQLGVTVPSNVTPQLKNVAAVAVHAVLPAFVKPGQTIDITVNSIVVSAMGPKATANRLVDTGQIRSSPRTAWPILRRA